MTGGEGTHLYATLTAYRVSGKQWSQEMRKLTRALCLSQDRIT